MQHTHALLLFHDEIGERINWFYTADKACSSVSVRLAHTASYIPHMLAVSYLSFIQIADVYRRRRFEGKKQKKKIFIMEEKLLFFVRLQTLFAYGLFFFNIVNFARKTKSQTSKAAASRQRIVCAYAKGERMKNITIHIHPKSRTHIHVNNIIT